MDFKFYRCETTFYLSHGLFSPIPPSMVVFQLKSLAMPSRDLEVSQGIMVESTQAHFHCWLFLFWSPLWHCYLICYLPIRLPFGSLPTCIDRTWCSSLLALLSISLSKDTFILNWYLDSKVCTVLEWFIQIRVEDRLRGFETMGFQEDALLQFSNYPDRWKHAAFIARKRLCLINCISSDTSMFKNKKPS